jgi:pyruvate formate lyase activating enzyme
MMSLEQCGRCHEHKVLSPTLGFCSACIRDHFEEVWPHIASVHRDSRERFGLAAFPPRKPKGGLRCGRCQNLCQLGEGETGYCGTRRREGNRIVGGDPAGASLSFYFDPLPTNCVAEWVCAATGNGYPAYSHSPGPEYGWRNLAVFYRSCSFNCLFCQNWHFKERSPGAKPVSAAELAAQVREDTACICFFGGDPAPQLPHALECARLARAQKPGILRVCFETSGAVSRKLLGRMAEVSLQSGGCIKFDLKAWSEPLHLALTGVPNRGTLENFRQLAARFGERKSPPLLVASTLLVPGYVDEHEVARIASFISSLNPDIPYALLGFAPHFYLQDLPRTSGEHAERCLRRAREAGLRNVRVANRHLLGNAYP